MFYIKIDRSLVSFIREFPNHSTKEVFSVFVLVVMDATWPSCTLPKDFQNDLEHKTQSDHVNK